MNSSSISKTVLSTPVVGEASGSGMMARPAAPARFRSIRFNDSEPAKNKSQVAKEINLKRIKAIRKELEFIQDTAWKYQPIEHYIGQ